MLDPKSYIMCDPDREEPKNNQIQPDPDADLPHCYTTGYLAHCAGIYVSMCKTYRAIHYIHYRHQVNLQSSHDV